MQGDRDVGEKWLLLGGMGRVGRALSRALVEGGDRVLVTGRDEEERDSWGRDFSWAEGVSAEVVDFGSETQAESFVAALRSFAPDHAVLSFGQPDCEGRLTEIPMREFDRCLRDQLRAQLVAVRTVLPRLPEHGLFLLINGSTAVGADGGRGLVHVPAAAALSLARVLAAEQEEPGPRIATLLLEAAVEVPGLPLERQLSGETLAAALRILARRSRREPCVFGLAPGAGLRAVSTTVEESSDLEELA